ncbi:daxx-like protein [Rhagoletis pomonella]|uniref:daxx-like protein n=1 Tax=Rhagoletis pomonella TaxID=28610 RepID=UPI0017811D52|nr:daxx-like protein [Rhagoletis pomonella]
MRIIILLLIGISITLATAGTDSKSSKKATTVKPATALKSTGSENGKTATKPTAKTATTASTTRKTLKSSAGGTADASDKRGKRTLYDFENAGYLYPEIASRRAGYENDGQSYYPQSGYYNGQDAIAQFPTNFIGPQYYPQYLEAPEPIIEIIIKDSNETLPEPEPQPLVTKKKKEKVHVFYVNYKKDQNNKLHLESPIASLNNDDNEDEEEEEIVHYPLPATPAPPVKTTTLRTIIHPDSEKYHSNSGIHVTFGSEDKSQAGHQIEEHDAESIQNQVVAIPVGGSGQAGSYKADSYNTRADFGASPQGHAQAGASQLFTESFQQKHYQHQQQPQQQQPHQQAHIQKQQLPLQHTGNYFRPPAALVQQPQPSFYQKQQYTQYQPQHQQQQQTQQQRPAFNSAFNSAVAPPPAPPTPPSPSPVPTLQQLPQAQTQFRKTFAASSAPQSHFFFNQNQQYQQQPSNQQQSFFSSLFQKPTPAPAKQSVFFPTAPPKSQELPARQSGLPYQPVKFRPTLLPAQPHIKPVPIPAKLENTNYQTAQTHQQHYQQQQPQQQQPQQHQHAQPLKQQQNYHPQQPYQFNRQPQYVHQPTFSLPSPQPTQPNANSASSSSGSSGSSNYFKQSQQSHSHTQLLSQKLASSRYQPQQPQAHQSQQQSQQPLQQQSHQQSYQTQQKTQQSQKQAFQSQQISSSVANGPTAASLHSSDPIKSLHNYFGADPSKETELLKSIPKYEQHITETIETPIGGGQYNGFGSFGFHSQNQVLHDIPAPQLGPTPAPNHAQQSYSSQQQQHNQYTSGNAGSSAVSSSGHYISTAAQHTSQSQAQAPQEQQHFSNFVTAHNSPRNGYSTTTLAPPQYAQTTDGEKVMIVTPMPPNAYNQYHSSQFPQQTGATHVLASQPTNYAQQPRQTAGSLIASSLPNTAAGSSPQFSVSTLHSDVFKQLEQRRSEDKTPVSQFSFGAQVASGNDKPYLPTTQSTSSSSYGQASSTASSSNAEQNAQPTLNEVKSTKASQTLLQLPDEVPDDLRQQLLSSGILNNADISVLDYDKVGDVALENLPAEHLQHFYGAGGAAQISASKKVVTVVKPNGDKVALSEKDIERVKESNALPHKQGVDVKVVHFDADNEKRVSEKYIKSDATVVPPVDLAAERQYNRYLPLKINGAQFPLPDNEELRGKKVVSVVVLAPVEAQPPTNAAGSSSSNERRSEREASVDDKEVKFLGGDLIKTLVKKPTKENFKRWLEKEARTDVEQQSVILLVAKSSDNAEQEIFMYDISTGAVNKLNGELSSAFVNVAEENASSEDLEHASTLDPSVLETMMHKSRR